MMYGVSANVVETDAVEELKKEAGCFVLLSNYVNDKLPVFDDSQKRRTQAIKQALDPKLTGVCKSTGIK